MKIIEANFGSKDRGYVGQKVAFNPLKLPDRQPAGKFFFKGAPPLLTYDMLKTHLLNNDWSIIAFSGDSYELKCLGNNGKFVEGFLQDITVFIEGEYLNFK